jgi:hypothetical protein
MVNRRSFLGALLAAVGAHKCTQLSTAPTPLRFDRDVFARLMAPLDAPRFDVLYGVNVLRKPNLDVRNAF